MISSDTLAELYMQACEIDVQAFKPGNVSIYSAGHDMEVEDFRRSYQVSAEGICHPGYTLGERIFYAVKATREAVGCNTNLGIILLCAPVIHTFLNDKNIVSLHESLKKQLSVTTIEDAEWMFKAIALAAPGGLGTSDQADVQTTPTITLLDAMKIAQQRDKIAELFVTDYRDIFDYCILMYNCGIKRFGTPNWAALSVYLGALSCFPDSHIERKYGGEFTPWVKSESARMLAKYQSTRDPESLIPVLHDVDAAFKAKGINPGTSADITVATVLTVFLEKELMNSFINPAGS